MHFGIERGQRFWASFTLARFVGSVRAGMTKTIALDHKLQVVERLADEQRRLTAREVRLLDPGRRLSELSRS
jgi:hypothetical protein